MFFAKEKYNFLDTEPLEFGEEITKMTKVKTDSATLRKMRRADERFMQHCYYCQKEFLARVASGYPWPYTDSHKSKKRWFCSWTCLAKSRKERKK